MFVSADTMTLLLESGLPSEKLVEIVRAFERDALAVSGPRTTSADRQARYRARKRNGDVTGDATPVTQTLSPSPPPPDPPHPAPIPVEIYIPRAKGPTSTEIARGFLAFWTAYPRKKSKDAAAKAFTSAMKRIPDPDPLAVILAGLERAMPGWDEPTFIPYPASWLNAGGWDDEAPSPRTGTRNDRSTTDNRADARSVWADIIADSDGPRVGPAEPLRLAG